MLATGSVTAADGSTIPLNSEVSRDEGSALQKLIHLYKPRVTLEIGLAYGVSALIICEALAEIKGEKHIVIDPYQFGVQSLNFVSGGYPALRKLARYIATHRSYSAVSGGAGRPISPKRRLFDALTATLRMPLLSGVGMHLIRADVLEPDSSLGLPPGNFIAFQKTAEDVLGDGSAGSRRWDQHRDF